MSAPKQAPEGTALLRIPEVAAELRVGRSTIYRYIEAGELPVVRIGPRKLTRIERSALEAYIARAGSAA